MEGVDRHGQQKMLLELFQECIEVSAVAIYRFTAVNFIRCYTARISELREQGHIIEFDNANKLYRYKGMWKSPQLALNLQEGTPHHAKNN